jgi:VIT1/CCC1 family predicted Fe2+/Mn2+ transporter/rubrerythrin
MDKKDEDQQYINGLLKAWNNEQASARIYRALAEHESSETRRNVLNKLAETEEGHAARWTAQLAELGAAVPIYRDTLSKKFWRWLLIQSGTENALNRIESSEDDDTEMYAGLAKIAPTETQREAITLVQKDEEMHGRLTHSAGSSQTPNDPQSRLDVIMHKESWHRHGGGWIGQAIYGANDGLGSVFGIVSGVAGATAGGPAVLVAGLAGMLASALSMGSGAYLATKAEREVNEAEIARERREIETKPNEEKDELSLFYQLKGIPQDEADVLADRLIAQPDVALRTLSGEELGLSEQTFPNPWTAAISASISTGLGAFIPIIPFFFVRGYPAIIASFAISTLSHFLIGAAKTIVTGLSPWRSGAEMTIVGLGEALITYALGLVFGPMVG